jgi:hypothetical protein
VPHGVDHRLQEQVPELADHHADDLAGFGSGGGGEPGGAKLGDLPARQFGEPFQQAPPGGDALPRTSIGKLDKKAMRAAYAGIYRQATSAAPS